MTGAGLDREAPSAASSCEPTREAPCRPNELRAGDGEDGHRNGKTELGEAPVGEQVSIDLDHSELTTRPRIRSDDRNGQDREQHVADEDPPPPSKRFADDQERERERENKGRLPQTRRPAEQRGERLRKLSVDIGRQTRDNSRKAGNERRQDEERRIDRPTISSAGLGGREESQVP